MRVGLSGAIYLRSDLRQRYEDLSSQSSQLSSVSVLSESFFMATKRVKGSRQTEKKCLVVIKNCQQTMHEKCKQRLSSVPTEIILRMYLGS